MIRLFTAKQFYKNTSEQLIGKSVHLFGKPNHFASEERLSKCNKRSTVIAFRILVKPHKPLNQNSLEKTLTEFLYCYVTASNFNERELHHN